VDVIYAACSESAHLSTSLFSATLPDWVEQIASSVLHSPMSIVVGAKNVSSLNVDQSLLFVGQVCDCLHRSTVLWLTALFAADKPNLSALFIFCCSTRRF
jgi:superfamily II DNA/RNA helicase